MFSITLACMLSPLIAVPNKSEPKAIQTVDAERVEASVAILRVKLERNLGGESGVNWYRVKVLEVYKNNTPEKLGPSLDVCTMAKMFRPGIVQPPGVPAEECTLYLEKHPDPRYWKLLGGTSELGVSHIKK